MRKAPGPQSPGAFIGVRLERVGDESADDAAGDRDEHGVVAGAYPVVAVRRLPKAVVAGVRDHHVVGRIAAIEPLAALPTTRLAAVVLVELLHHDALLDLLVAAPVMTVEVRGRS